MRKLDYVVIPNFIIDIPKPYKVSWVARMLLAKIWSFDRADSCYASDAYFSELLKITDRQVREHLKNLESGGFISRSYDDKTGKRSIHFNFNHEGWKKTSIEETPSEEGVEENFQHIKEDKNSLNNKRPSLSKREKDFVAEVHKVVGVKTPLVDDFIKYWTEPNKTKKKMRFESENFFDISRRINTWQKNEEKFKKTGKVSRDKTEGFKKTPFGEYMVWCSKCGNDLFYKEYHMNKQEPTSCCGVDYVNDKTKVQKFIQP